jgi:hypothetical protein
MVGKSLTAGADAVIGFNVMSAASDLADIASLDEEEMHAYLKGSITEGCIRITGLSPSYEGAVGMVVSNIEGGTSPTEEVSYEMISTYPDGLLMVIDPDVCEIAFYKVVEGALASAKVLVSE